jgi:hypothetical protein
MRHHTALQPPVFRIEIQAASGFFIANKADLELGKREEYAGGFHRAMNGARACQGWRSTSPGRQLLLNHGSSGP